MDTFTLTLADDTTLQVSYSSPWRYQATYAVTVQRGGQCALGWARCKALSLQTAQLESLDFYDDPGWLRRAFDPREAVGGWRVSPTCAPHLSLYPPAAMTRLLSAWLATDYRRRLYEVVMSVEAGLAMAEDYRLLWHYELCREAGVNPAEEPTPAELVAAFRLIETDASWEVRQQAARRRRLAKIQRHAQEMARWNAWIGDHLGGLVQTTVFPYGLLEESGAPERFQTSRYEIPTSYEPIQVGGGDPIGYFESFGQNILAYAPLATVERWYRERWERERGAASALYVLNRELSGGGKGAWGDDYTSWVYRCEGESSLVALAREGTPVEIPWPSAYVHAIASKWYRIPLTVDLSGNREVGYGVPGVQWCQGPRPIPLAEEQWQQLLRLQGWIPLGGEENGAWPRQEDIDAYRAEWQRHSRGFPAISG